MKTRWLAMLAVAAVLTTACGGADDTSAGGADRESARTAAGQLNAQVASYDLTAGRPQRFVVGLLTAGQDLVGFGTVELAFAYLGTKAEPLKEPRRGPTATGDYRLIPGQQVPADQDGPRVIEGGRGVGVYGADGVEFADAGVWQVAVTAELDGRARTATAAFEVLADSAIPNVGDPAPRSENHLPGAPGVPPKAVDSRATDDGSVPDPELHRVTVAQAVTSGKPTMVVVSTPVYCVSRFCGPITETVATLSQRFQDRVEFVHLEVWRDYEGRQLNRAAAEWIYPTEKEEAHEPWVFVVGRDGVITHRFDNVATEPELNRAIAEVVA